MSLIINPPIKIKTAKTQTYAMIFDMSGFPINSFIFGVAKYS